MRKLGLLISFTTASDGLTGLEGFPVIPVNSGHHFPDRQVNFLGKYRGNFNFRSTVRYELGAGPWVAQSGKNFRACTSQLELIQRAAAKIVFFVPCIFNLL